MTTNPPIDLRSITDAERPFLEALDDLGQMAELRRQILARGESTAIANGLVGWLLAKKVGDPDTSGPSQRSNYRRILRDIVQENGGPGGEAIKARKARKAAARTASGVGTSLAFVAGAGMVVALYVTETPGADVAGDDREEVDQGESLAPVRMLCATGAVDSAPDVRMPVAA